VRLVALSGSYDEFLSFGNVSGPIIGEYGVSTDSAAPGFGGLSAIMIKQGNAVFNLPFGAPNCCFSPIFLTSDYVAGVPMEVSASLDAGASEREFSSASVNLINFSSPFEIVTPEPSSVLLVCSGIGVLVCRRRKAA
jgi:hypothetical protein